MMKDKLKTGIDEMRMHILFDYKGVQCGIDPILRNKRIDMWYGDKFITVKTVDEAMSVKLFDDKNLNEIAEDIEDVEGL